MAGLLLPFMRHYRADHGSILITSRRQRLSELRKSFPFQTVESEDAIYSLLQSRGLLASSTVVEVDQGIYPLHT
jgi:hypothetical protein